MKKIPKLRLVRRATHWKDRAAGWHVWRVTYPDGRTEIIHGTRDGVCRVADERWAWKTGRAL